MMICRYKPKKIVKGEPDLDRDGDMDGLKETAFCAGLQASGTVQAVGGARAQGQME